MAFSFGTPAKSTTQPFSLSSPAPTTGGFGSPSPKTTTGFGFGTPTKPAAGGGFGQPAASTGGMFGPPASTGGFGSPAPASTGGMFGAPASTGGFGSPAPASTGGMFGAPASTGGFGSPAPASTGGMFGGGGTSTFNLGGNTGGFGGGLGSGLGGMQTMSQNNVQVRYPVKFRATGAMRDLPAQPQPGEPLNRQAFNQCFDLKFAHKQAMRRVNGKVNEIQEQMPVIVSDIVTLKEEVRDALNRHGAALSEEETLLKDIRWAFQSARSITLEEKGRRRELPHAFFGELLGRLEERQEAYDQQISKLREIVEVRRQRAYAAQSQSDGFGQRRALPASVVGEVITAQNLHITALADKLACLHERVDYLRQRAREQATKKGDIDPFLQADREERLQQQHESRLLVEDESNSNKTPSTGTATGTPATGNATAGTGGFGSPAAGGGFGAKPTGSFGATTTTPGSGGFGGGGGFGSPTPAAGGGGMFGAKPAAAGGFGFGSPSTTTPAPGGFGAPASGAAGGAFGVPAAAPAGGGFGFGVPTAGGFGAQPAAQPTVRRKNVRGARK